MIPFNRYKLDGFDQNKVVGDFFSNRPDKNLCENFILPFKKRERSIEQGIAICVRILGIPSREAQKGNVVIH